MCISWKKVSCLTLVWSTSCLEISPQESRLRRLGLETNSTLVEEFTNVEVWGAAMTITSSMPVFGVGVVLSRSKVVCSSILQERQSYSYLHLSKIHSQVALSSCDRYPYDLLRERSLPWTIALLEAIAELVDVIRDEMFRDLHREYTRRRTLIFAFGDRFAVLLG